MRSAPREKKTLKVAGGAKNAIAKKICQTNSRKTRGKDNPKSEKWGQRPSGKSQAERTREAENHLGGGSESVCKDAQKCGWKGRKYLDTGKKNPGGKDLAKKRLTELASQSP